MAGTDDDRPRLPQPWFRAQAVGMAVRSVTEAEPWRQPRPGETLVGPFVRPPFQRGPAWTEAQQTRLVESVQDGYPIGAIVYNATGADNPCDAWLLDGQQRVTALCLYASGRLRVRGHLFTEHPEADRRAFLMRPLAAQEARIENETLCRRVYQALAMGGTPHAPEQYADAADAAFARERLAEIAADPNTVVGGAELDGRLRDLER